METNSCGRACLVPLSVNLERVLDFLSTSQVLIIFYGEHAFVLEEIAYHLFAKEDKVSQAFVGHDKDLGIFVEQEGID